MKKFAAVILVLALSILFTSASAESKNFGLAGVTDMDANLLYVVLEDNTVTDADGNPTDDMPYITMTIDDEAMTFVMTALDQPVEGTVEVLDETDTTVTLQLTPPEGLEPIIAVYSVEDVESITLFDEPNSMMFVLTVIEED